MEYTVLMSGTKTRVKVPCATVVTVPGFEEFTFFLHPALMVDDAGETYFMPPGERNYWAVSEAVTGLRVSNGGTRHEAVQSALTLLDHIGRDRFDESFARAIA